MWIAAVIGGAIAAVFLLFRGLQWHSDRTYRPSADAIRQIVPASLEGRLGLKAFDEFSCVRIAHDFRLEGIRERYNAIVNDPTCILGEITDSNATPLNDRGRARLRELLNELGGLRRGRST